MNDLSTRQEQIIDYIRAFLRRKGMPPTVRDIQEGCQISSTSVVDYNLQQLQRKGVLRRTPSLARGIELVEAIGRDLSDHLAVPVQGYIAAGQPLPIPGGDGWQAESFHDPPRYCS